MSEAYLSQTWLHEGDLDSVLRILNDTFIREPTLDELARITLDGLGYSLERVGQLEAVLEDGVLNIRCKYQYPVTTDYIIVNLKLPEGNADAPEADQSAG